jgi:3-deoxy-D-manno-octulosonic-acid transferase
VARFRDIYDQLDAGRGAVLVENADSIIGVLSTLLREPSSLRRMNRAAAETMARLGGATERTLAALNPFLAQIDADGQ